MLMLIQLSHTETQPPLGSRSLQTVLEGNITAFLEFNLICFEQKKIW